MLKTCCLFQSMKQYEVYLCLFIYFCFFKKQIILITLFQMNDKIKVDRKNNMKLNVAENKCR